MKLVLTETQLKELINKLDFEDIEEQIDTDTDTTPKPGVSDDQSGGEAPAGGTSKSDGYPDSTTKWEDVRSPIARGAGNQVGPIKKWTEAPNTQPERGVGNQLT